MVLQDDVAALLEPVARPLVELADPDARLPLVVPEPVLHDAHAVEPVLDVAAADDEPSVVPLAGAMRDQMWNVKAYSAEALARIGHDAAEAVPQLQRAIHDQDFRVKKAICLALGKIGEASAPAVPEIIKLLKDSQREVRNAAAVALEEIGTPEAKAVLAEYDWE